MLNFRSFRPGQRITCCHVVFLKAVPVPSQMIKHGELYALSHPRVSGQPGISFHSCSSRCKAQTSSHSLTVIGILEITGLRDLGFASLRETPHGAPCRLNPSKQLNMSLQPETAQSAAAPLRAFQITRRVM